MVRRYFGTDGIRGRANGVITPELALKVGQAAGLMFRNGEHRHRVLIGKDTRLSGYMIETALVAGFTSVGMDVLLTGPMPTPAIAMLTRSMRADLGVMISASHNPYDDNGIKLFGPDGFKLSDQIEPEIEELIDSDISKRLGGLGAALGRARRIDGVQDRYIEFAKRTLPRELTFEGLRVVVDCANGAAYSVAPEALWELGRRGRSPSASSRTASTSTRNAARPRRMRWRRKVREVRADVGIALDGDADRLVIVDERGHVVDGDQLMAVIAESWNEDGPAGQARRGRHRDVESRPGAPSGAVSACRSPARRSATATCSSACASMATISAASSPAISSCRTTPRPATASWRRLQVLSVVKRRGQSGLGGLPPVRAAAAGAAQRALPERQAAGGRPRASAPSKAPRSARMGRAGW